MSDDAYQTALKMLSRRDYFRVELEKRISQKGFLPEEIERALDRCTELNLVNDVRLAERFVEFRSVDRGWGPRRLVAELRHRGVADEVAEKSTRLAPDLLEAALGTALRRAELRAPREWWRLPERRARMVSSLIARGFQAETAIEAVEQLASTREKQDHANDDQ
jgi:SOS response regulatory protein OraA/RecX